MTSISINPIGELWLVAVVAAVLVGLLFFGPSRRRTTGRQRVVLAGLRALAVAMVVFAILRPAVVYTELKPQSASIVILVDTSQSLQVTDELDGKSRWAVLRERLTDVAKPLDTLSRDFDVRAYGFSREIEPLSIDAGKIDLPDTPDGRQTALGSAIDDVLRREASGRVLAMLLLSDGAQRAFTPRDLPPQQPARQLGAQGIPLYTCTFGGSGSQAADLAVSELLAPETAFAKMPVEIVGELRVRGYGNQELKVQLLWEIEPGKMAPVDTRLLRVELDADGLARLPLVFRHTPAEPGEYKVALRAEPQEGEQLETNNMLSTFVRVRSDGVKVLMLDGGAFVGGGSLPEQRGVRWALATSHDMTLGREHFNYSQRGLDRREDFALGKYDVVLLLNVDTNALDRPTWQAVTEWIRLGGGLMMAGGEHSFGPGGFRQNPLADALPIDIGRAERQNFGERPAPDMHLPGEVAMRPTRTWQRHWIMDLGTADDGLVTWDDVPSLDGANRFDPSRIKIDASVLAESADDKKMPLLISGTWGGGRVLAFAGDSTEKWRRYGRPEVLKRFWRQVVLWLAKKDEADEGEVWVRLPQRRVLPGEPMTFAVGANAPKGESPVEAMFTAELVLPDGFRRPIELTRRGDDTFGELADLSIPGDYRVVAKAAREGEPLGTAEARFVIEAQDLELDNPASNAELMASLARATSDVGGRVLAPEQLPLLLEELAKKKLELKEEVLHKETHWDTWPFFLLLVGLLSAEWYLRKRWGLV